MFLQLVPSVPSWLTEFGIPIMVLGILLTVYSFDWSKKHLHEKKSFKQINESELIDYFNCFLPNTPNDKALKIYCSQDKKERVIINQLEDGTIGVKKEILELYDWEDARITKSYGGWIPIDGCGIYDTVETAIKENAQLLKDMKEIDISSLKNPE